MEKMQGVLLGITIDHRLILHDEPMNIGKEGGVARKRGALQTITARTELFRNHMQKCSKIP
jgi:hypothetical protein